MLRSNYLVLDTAPGTGDYREFRRWRLIGTFLNGDIRLTSFSAWPFPATGEDGLDEIDIPGIVLCDLDPHAVFQGDDRGLE